MRCVAGVVDADDDQRLDAAGVDQLRRGLADAPVLAFLERGVGLEQILPVVHVEDGVPGLGVPVVARRQPDEDVAIVLEEFGVERFVTAELAIGRVHRAERNQYRLRSLMVRDHHKWFSRSLNRDMELLAFGHAGRR